MRWEEVQERFPNEWVVLEATKAHSMDGNLYIEEVVVVDRFDDSTADTTSCISKALIANTAFFILLVPL